jgi:hypothetical protein
MRSTPRRSFRGHFQRVVLASLIRTLEDDAERLAAGGWIKRRRARRAENEAARLREVLASLGPPAPTEADVDPAATVSARIAAYTQAPVVPKAAAPPRLPNEAARDERPRVPAPSAAARPRRALLRPLAVLWACCAVALPVALVARGVHSPVSASADVALILTTIAVFAASFFGGARTAQVVRFPGVERRVGGDRRRRDSGPPAGGPERRSGRDRRLERGHPVPVTQ